MKPVLRISGTSERFVVDHLTITEAEGMHVRFSAFISGPGDNLRRFAGAPCSIEWGSGVTRDTEWGYIDTPTQIEHLAARGTMILGLGATSVMRSGAARSWSRTTPYRIARSLTRPYGLAIAADSYEAGIDSMMQTSQSDWATLQDLADKVGMSLVARGVQVRIIDVQRALGRAQLRDILTIGNLAGITYMDTASPVGFDRFEFNGIDSLGENFTVRGGTGPVKRHAPENFGTLEDALLAKQRWEDRTRHLQKALASYQGATAARVGDVVRVAGKLWYVARSTVEVDGIHAKTDTQLELHRTNKARPTSADIIPNVPVALRQGALAAARRSEIEL